jgi:hypothetical protein
MKKVLLGALGSAALLAFSTAASAAIVSHSSSITVIPQPGSVTNGTPSDGTNYLAFNELQGFTLVADLMVDGGSILAGTKVDSHMILLNSNGPLLEGAVSEITFSGNILGTMSDEDGGLLAASDFLGAPTSYTNFNNRGLEDGGNYPDSLSFSGATATVQFNVTEPGDWVRIVTVAQVPVPAGILLLPMGLFAMGAMRRKGRKTA